MWGSWASWACWHAWGLEASALLGFLGFLGSWAFEVPGDLGFLLRSWGSWARGTVVAPVGLFAQVLLEIKRVRAKIDVNIDLLNILFFES